MRRARLAAVFLFACSARGLFAHDFWLEPSSFHPAVGSELYLALRVGEHFSGEPVPRNEARIVKFVLVSGSGEEAVGGLPGTDPAGSIRISTPGFTLIGYRSNRSPITLEPAKFEKYLEVEGLDAVLRARSEKGERDRPGVEVYSRCAKALVAAGGEGRSGFDRVVGLTLEIVPRDNPSNLARGGKRFRILYEGKPLAGTLVKAISLEEKNATLSARSGRDGEVLLPLARRGVWLVEAVHMVAAPAGSGADWESLWASLTFEIP